MILLREEPKRGPIKRQHATKGRDLESYILKNERVPWTCILQAHGRNTGVSPFYFDQRIKEQELETAFYDLYTLVLNTSLSICAYINMCGHMI